MANTYRKIYLQIVFAVKGRKSLLLKEWRSDLFKYISGSINKRGHYSLAVNGYNDHIHLFFDYNPNELIPDLVREVKKSSNKLINDKNWCKTKFEWQKGYGVFSHGRREKSNVMEYIMNQENHHRKLSFREEYFSLLKEFNIEYDNKYVFDFMDTKIWFETNSISNV